MTDTLLGGACTHLQSLNLVEVTIEGAQSFGSLRQMSLVNCEGVYKAIDHFIRNSFCI
jgi:hypothetical protein